MVARTHSSPNNSSSDRGRNCSGPSAEAKGHAGPGFIVGNGGVVLDRSHGGPNDSSAYEGRSCGGVGVKARRCIKPDSIVVDGVGVVWEM